MRFSILAALASGALLLGNALPRAPARADDPTQQVMRTEIAFAKTMADRDYAAFGRFVSNEAVFFTSEQPLRGKEAVLDHWKRYYDKGPAPFSWAPERVEVLGFRHARAQHRPRARPERQADRDVHFHLATGRAGRVAHRVRQGESRVQERGAVKCIAL